MNNVNTSIAIFIPVYNGERYLKKTLESILVQTYSNFKIYCVDDSSTDNSLAILREFACTDTRINVFQKLNGGNTAVSWNYILPYIKEDYILYMSQDDLLREDTLAKMIIRAVETDADCILPDMCWFYEDVELNHQKKISPPNNNRNIILSGKEAFVKSLFWDIHGFALRKRELYTGVFFLEDAFDSDELITRVLFQKSKKVVFSEGVFFYRQDNPLAITKIFNSKTFQTLLTYKRVYDLFDIYEDKRIMRIKWVEFMDYNFKSLVKKYKQITDWKDEERIQIKKQLLDFKRLLVCIFLRNEVKLPNWKARFGYLMLLFRLKI